ncbi:hypothetical protein M5K25_023140 [Dendrobium thyrsiflorum]|uniref:ubiquitinyl hydrolase 1 n=1 Tax=Dendrobium thyrsiflorum TaxID=117978 RepID=A0ABD0UE40_DENTH
MPDRWDRGWGGAVLLVCFVLFPAIALVVRWKWRLADAKRAEIIRLVRFAAAEAEMSERETAVFASASDPPASVVIGGGAVMSNCAVCHSPTTSRCARCKVVKYCSGKCQIIHWRKGHRDECHPPHVDHFKGQPHFADLKGGQAERNDDHCSAYQNISIMDAGQAEETIIGDSRPEIDGKLDDVESFETSFNKSVPSKSDLSSATYSQNGNVRQKSSASTSKKQFATSLIDSSASADCTLPHLGEIPHVASSNAGLTGAQSGQQHSNASSSYVSFTNPKISFCTILESSKTFVGSEKSTFMNEDAECKLNGPSNMKSCGSNRSLNVRLCQTNNNSRTTSLCSKTSDKFENFNFSENHNECQETVVEIVGSADYNESHTHNNNQIQVDAVLHSKGSLNVSNVKSFSSTASPITLEPTATKDSSFKKSCSVTYGEKNKEQFKFLSSPLAQGPTIVREGPHVVENDPPVSTKSLEVSNSLLNGKTFVGKDAKQISSSPLRHVQPGACNYGCLKYNYKMLFSYDLFIKLYNSDKVWLNPCGLINCGNSCYANAALQCLAFTRPLAAYLLEGLHAKTCPKKEWCFTCALESLLMEANHRKSPLSPVGIISHIHVIGSSFSQGREEDAHEFLRHAIDAMQSACLKEAGPNAVTELAQETTLIQLIFGGYLHSKIKCMRCKGKSERRERMMDLTVEIHGDIETLEIALARFTATEVMEGENKYKCGRCKSYEQAKKQLTILEAPNVLTIALKRYQSGKFGKLNKMVRFPEYLNLAPYMRGSEDKSPVYRLYAVVVHNDVMNAAFSGHYVCYVKNALGKWFKADDSVVKQVEFQEVLSQGAYMLLYARCSPRAPSLLRKEIANKSRLKQNGDSHSSKARSSSNMSHPGLAVTHRGKSQASHSDDPKFGLHDLFDERLRHSKLDISSDTSSLFSCSDEGSSWSAESTKDSATTEDFTESVNGEPGHINCNSPLRFSEDSDGFTCSPNSNGKMDSPDLSPLDSRMDKWIGRKNLPFLHSTKQCRNLTEQSSSRSETNWVSSSEIKPTVLLKRSSRDTTAQTFY